MKQGLVWDENKARINLQKHGISFDEAATGFLDLRLLTFYDEEHSEADFRFTGIGLASCGRILRVVFTKQNDEIRIIN